MTPYGSLALLSLVLAGCAAPSGLHTSRLPEAALHHPDEYLVIAVSNERPIATARAGSTLRGYDAVPAYGASARGARIVAAVERDYGLHTVAGWPIDPLHLECVVVRIEDPGHARELLRRLSQDSRVRLAEPLQEFSTLTSYNDPYAPLQKSIGLMDLDRAHEVARGAGVTVAVIDTGANIEHPDLLRAVVGGEDFTGGSTTAFRQDLHGTEVAGVIAARANNHIGIVGIAPESQLLILKACWQAGVSPQAVCNTFTLAQALTRAVQSGARLVNLSLSGPTDPLLTQILQWGISRGVIFVGAVGPDGILDAFPAGVPGVLAVDRAESTERRSNVLYAPGDGILTLTPEAHYDYASGSSMAAAQVTGLLALLLGEGPISADRARGILATTAVMPHGSPFSVVNACAALAMVVPITCRSRPDAPLAATP